ncbi:MAG: glycosyltransferase family 2 protein [Candidatus Andersenbacteria bacterium]
MPTIAVLIPCYNEHLTIAKVVEDFTRHLPTAQIYVFDNNSRDGSADKARQAGATVIASRRQGKGYVVRHMFAAVDADLYVMVDGDDTYPAEEAGRLIHLAELTGADMVVATRLQDFSEQSFRLFHNFGNRLVASLISRLFKVRVTDVLSGYRVFSREFVKTVPLTSAGFEIETEMTLQAASKNFLIVEQQVAYRARPTGSTSKLNTYRDGAIILRALFSICKHYRPLLFFSGLSGVIALGALAAGLVPIADYIETKYVSHVPLAILAVGLSILASLALAIGLILDSAVKYHNESFELWKRTLKK